jgi:hypothetical protein
MELAKQFLNGAIPDGEIPGSRLSLPHTMSLNFKTTAILFNFLPLEVNGFQSYCHTSAGPDDSGLNSLGSSCL